MQLQLDSIGCHACSAIAVTLQGLITDSKAVDLAVLSVGYIEGVGAFFQSQAVGHNHLASRQLVLRLIHPCCTVSDHPCIAVAICHKDCAI